MFEAKIFIVCMEKETSDELRAMIQERKPRNGIGFRVVGEAQALAEFSKVAESVKPHCLIVDEDLINKAVIDTRRGISVVAITADANRREGEIDYVNLSSGSGFVMQKIEGSWRPFTTDSLKRADKNADHFYKYMFPGLDYTSTRKDKRRNKPVAGAVFAEPIRKDDDEDGSFQFSSDVGEAQKDDAVQEPFSFSGFSEDPPEISPDLEVKSDIGAGFSFAEEPDSAAHKEEPSKAMDEQEVSVQDESDRDDSPQEALEVEVEDLHAWVSPPIEDESEEVLEKEEELPEPQVETSEDPEIIPAEVVELEQVEPDIESEEREPEQEAQTPQEETSPVEAVEPTVQKEEAFSFGEDAPESVPLPVKEEKDSDPGHQEEVCSDEKEAVEEEAPIGLSTMDHILSNIKSTEQEEPKEEPTEEFRLKAEPIKTKTLREDRTEKAEEPDEVFTFDKLFSRIGGTPKLDMGAKKSRPDRTPPKEAVVEAPAEPPVKQMPEATVKPTPETMVKQERPEEVQAVRPEPQERKPEPQRARQEPPKEAKKEETLSKGFALPPRPAPKPPKPINPPKETVAEEEFRIEGFLKPAASASKAKPDAPKEAVSPYVEPVEEVPEMERLLYPAGSYPSGLRSRLLRNKDGEE